MSSIDRGYIKEACKKLGYSLEVIDEKEGFYFLDNRSKKLPFISGLIPINSRMNGYIANHKNLTYQLLNRVGIRIPKTLKITNNFETVSDLKSKVSSFFDNKDYPLFIKPDNGTQGRGISVVTSFEKLFEKAVFLLKKYDGILIQEYINAIEYRCFIIDGKVKYIYQRIPAEVVGDGVKIFEELVLDLKKQTDLDLEFGIDREYILKQLLAIECSWQTIIPKGKKIRLSTGVSYKSGSTFSSLQFELPQTCLNWLQTISEAMNLRVFSIDFFNLGKDLTNPDNFIVIEINSRPYFTFFEKTKFRSFAIDIWAEILQKTFESNYQFR